MGGWRNNRVVRAATSLVAACAILVTACGGDGGGLPEAVSQAADTTPDGGPSPDPFDDDADDGDGVDDGDVPSDSVGDIDSDGTAADNGNAVVQIDASGGADSPEAAVQELIDAATASDPLGLLAVLHRSERLLIQDLYNSAAGAMEGTGSVDIDKLLQSLQLDVSVSGLTVQPLTDGLAWVTTDTADVGFQVDPAGLADAVAADVSTLTLEPAAASLTPAADRVGVAVVREGDRWFVSALYTAAEMVRNQLDLPARFGAAVPAPAVAAATPLEAVAALAAAVNERNMRAVASQLDGLEARVVTDYESSLGGELLSGISGLMTNFTIGNSAVVEQGDGVTVVEIDAWSAQVSGELGDDYVDTSVTATGLCGDWSKYDSYDATYTSGSGCAFNEPSYEYDIFSVLADAGWRGPRIVVVDSGSGWKVSVVRTLLNAVAPFADDPVTAASLYDAVTYTPFGSALPGYFVAGKVLEMVGAALEPLGAGEHTATPTLNGRVAMFRVQGPATVSVRASDPSCWYEVLEVFAGDETLREEQNDCVEPLPVGSGQDVLVLVHSGSNALMAPFGPVTVTVAPG